LADLYQITGKEQYLAAARLFEQPDILDPLAVEQRQKMLLQVEFGGMVE